jgi:hypothetical protein
MRGWRSYFGFCETPRVLSPLATNPLAIGETEFVNGFTNAEARFGTTGLAKSEFETTPEPQQGSVLRESQYDVKTCQNVRFSIGHTWRFLSTLNRYGNPARVRTDSEIQQHFGK